MCQSIRFSILNFTDAELVPVESRKSGDEIFMHSHDPGALLPVEQHGRLSLVPWGNSKIEGLPRTGFCKIESLEKGKWAWLQPERVKIMASLARTKGIWFEVRHAISGIMVRDREGNPHCYMLTQPATHYFKTMTGAERMPILLDQIL